MKIAGKTFILAALLAAIFSFPVRARDVLLSAAQIPLKSVNLSFYAVSSAQSCALSTSRAYTINVGGVSYTSVSESQFSVEKRFSGVGARAVYNPSDGNYFRAGVSAGNEEIVIPTVSGDNILSGDGAFFGFGIRKVVLPATVVTPAVALDLGAEYGRSRPEALKTSSGVSATNASFTTAEYSAAVLLSKKFRKLEPTAALRISRVLSELDDRISFEKVSGARDNVSFAAGLKINFREAESLFVEAGFSPDRRVAAGVTFCF